jgi:hypothetical protein
MCPRIHACRRRWLACRPPSKPRQQSRRRCGHAQRRGPWRTAGCAWAAVVQLAAQAAAAAATQPAAGAHRSSMRGVVAVLAGWRRRRQQQQQQQPQTRQVQAATWCLSKSSASWWPPPTKSGLSCARVAALMLLWWCRWLWCCWCGRVETARAAPTRQRLHACPCGHRVCMHASHACTTCPAHHLLRARADAWAQVWV